MTTLASEEIVPELEHLLDKINWIRARGRGTPDFLDWKAAVDETLRRCFGEESRHLADFARVRYTPATHSAFLDDNAQEVAFQRGLERARAILESAIQDAEEGRAG